MLKIVYRWFARLSITFLPITFVGVYVAFSVYYGKYWDLSLSLKRNNNPYGHPAYSFFKALGYLTITINLLSCVITFLVVKLAFRITKKVKLGGN